jgi:hypothetical protein
LLSEKFTFSRNRISLAPIKPYLWLGSLFGHPSKQDIHGSPDAYSPRYAFLAWQASFAATRPQPAALFVPKKKQTGKILYVMLP